jgi:diadenylate cyclase
MKLFWDHTLIHLTDIALLTVVIYQILRLIQGTRAVQVLRGLLVLAIATYVVGRVLELPVLSRLLRTFWLEWAVILAVVFQPELRSLLAQLGSHRSGRILLSPELGFIDEIIKALKEASVNRLGMLIVLEQETGLRNFIGTGTVINGEVTSDLLLTLFHPRTLLHDGAVILREDRLVAAGCVLPLSNDPDLARVLGTRHRAALGLTEISDAVVLVVSEETGSISIARDGRLERQVALDDLRGKLRDFYKSLSERGLFRRTASREGL